MRGIFARAGLGGRSGRLAYFGGALGAGIVLVLAFSVLAQAAAAPEGILRGCGIALAGLLLLASLWLFVRSNVRRLRDAGFRPLWALLPFVVSLDTRLLGASLDEASRSGLATALNAAFVIGLCLLPSRPAPAPTAQAA